MLVITVEAKFHYGILTYFVIAVLWRFQKKLAHFRTCRAALCHSECELYKIPVSHVIRDLGNFMDYSYSWSKLLQYLFLYHKTLFCSKSQLPSEWIDFSRKKVVFL